MSLKRFKEIFNGPRSNKPAFLIIGTQKAGTTALHQYLSLHPELGESKKEIKYFNCDVNYSKGKNFYLSHFGPQPDKKSPLFFDVSPGYLAGEKAAERIFDFNPKIKLIAILRDPAERAFSAWNMYRPRFHENDNWFFDWMNSCNPSKKIIRRRNRDFNNFGEYIDEEIKFIENCGIDSKEFIEAPIIKQGFYSHHLHKFMNNFPFDQFLILDFKEFKLDLPFVMKKIESFVGISNYRWQEIKLNPIFEGNYENFVISIQDRKKLNEIFKADKNSLVNNFNINFLY